MSTGADSAAKDDAASPAQQARQARLALLAATLAAAAFIGMDSTAKLLTGRFDTTQITFLRFAAGTFYALPLWLWFRPPLPARGQWRWHLLRAALLPVTLGAWFFSLSRLPLVQAVGVGYTAPLFIALMAMWLLGERPSRWIWAALALGALGVAVALWPELSATHAPGSAARLVGMAAAGISAIAYAGVVVLARHQAQHDALWTILLLQNLLPLLLLAGPAAWGWQPMAWSDAPILLLLGGLATVGVLCITWAFSHIEASRAAPMEYTGLVWAALLGFLVFGEVPTVWSLSSAGLIVIGCLLLIKR